MRRETKTWVGHLDARRRRCGARLHPVPRLRALRSGAHVALRPRSATLRARNAELRAENERLAREADGLRSDLAAIERVARNELGWVHRARSWSTWARQPKALR